MIIAHDLGTSGNKATLVDNEGKMLASVTVSYGADWGSDGKAEQNPHDWWHALCQATQELIRKANVNPSDIEAVGFSGQMMGVVPLDGGGEPVRPAIIWADTRSTKQCDQMLSQISMEEAYKITGHRLNPTYSLTKIMWMRDTEPDNFARMKKFCLAKDYVAFKLTGVIVTDPSDASSTNAFDQAKHDWSEDIIEAANLDRRLFPDIAESSDVIGHVTEKAAHATGLRPGTKVVIGGGDGPTAALGAGVIDEASGAYACLGSSSWVSVASDQPLLDPQMRSMTFNHVIPGRFVPTATMQAGGASVSWAMDVLGEKRHYDSVLAEAAQVEAATKGLFFLPYLIGERSPYWNPLARGVFAGLHMEHKQPHMVRAVLEGVTFNLLTGLKAFTDAGMSIDHIDAIGGLAKSELMVRLMADIWGIPVAARNIVDEANAIGAAVVAGVGAGIFDDYAISEKLSKRSADTEPNVERTRAYQRPYELFLDAYDRFEPWFNDIAGLP